MLQQYDAHVKTWREHELKDFPYDGAPVVRTPRILRDVTVEAGFASPDPENPDGFPSKSRTERKYLERHDPTVIRADIDILRMRLLSVLDWFERDEGSMYDYVGYIDHITRALDSQLDAKRSYLKKIIAQMRAVERNASGGGEFDTEQWRRLSELRERLIMGGHMLADALKAHHEARGIAYLRSGLPQSAYKSWKTMKQEKDQFRKLKMVEISADRLLGMSPEELAVYRKIAMFDEFDKDGVDGRPDEQHGATLKDKAAHEELKKIAAMRTRIDKAEYKRRKPEAKPKPGIDYPESGEPGSQHRRITKEVKKNGLPDLDRD